MLRSLAVRLPRATSAVLRHIGRPASTLSPALQGRVDQFRRDVDKHLPQDGKNVVFATEWLITDNVLLDLLREHFPDILSGMDLVAIDTLHLFPEVFVCADLVEERYGKQARWWRPLDVKTRADFEQKWGDLQDMDSADFDYVSKVEPFQRALAECNKDIVMTGRRLDQGDAFTKLAIWDDMRRTLNPMAHFNWEDILAYVDARDVPVNPLHNYAFRSRMAVDAQRRHLPELPWEKVDLGKPYWRATDAELKGNPPAVHTYVFKSLGDTHTTVPVEPHESERAGRFVRQSAAECGIHTRTTSSGSPHGGSLVDLIVKEPAVARSLVAKSVKSVELNERQACDVFCLVSGAYSPLTGFMDQPTYDSVVATTRLPSKQLFGLPVTLDVQDIGGIAEGDSIVLRWADEDVAVLEISSIWQPNKVEEAKQVLGTASLEHPSVYALVAEHGSHYVGGKLHGLRLPSFDYPAQTPAEVRALLPEGKDVVAFHSRSPIHRSHFELLKYAQRDISDSVVFVHPACGPVRADEEVDSKIRIDSYDAVRRETEGEQPRFHWAYLPYSVRLAGPREVIQHMIIRKNFGATHFIVGEDLDVEASSADGKEFYQHYDALNVGKKFSGELGLTVTHYENMVYVDAERGYVEESVARKIGHPIAEISSREFRRKVQDQEEIPDWFTFSSVVDVFRKAGGVSMH